MNGYGRKSPSVQIRIKEINVINVRNLAVRVERASMYRSILNAATV